jgi:hypothetical protein
MWSCLSINVILLCLCLWCDNVFVMSPCCGGCHILAGSRMQPLMALIKARYKHWSMSNGLHSESPLQTCQQCNRQCKSPLPVLDGGLQDLAHSSRYWRRRLKARVSFNREKADARRNRYISIRRGRGDEGSRNASLMLISQRNNHFTWPVTSCGNGRCLMPVTNPMCAEMRVK